jgi:hypothetical protein
MRARSPDWLALACAAWLSATCALARAFDVVPWQAAASRAGDLVTVEGDVVEAHIEGATLVLLFSTDDPNAFRVILLIPLITNLPHQPQRLYEGRRVRATGTVRRFGSRSEMIVRSPDAIEIIGMASTPGTTETPPTTPPTTTPRGRRTPTTTAPPPTLPPPAATAPPTPPPTTPPAPAVEAAPPPPPPPTPAPPPPAPAPAAPAPTQAPPPLPPPSPKVSAPPSPPPPAAAPAPPPAKPEEQEPPRPFERVDPCVQARNRWRQAAAVANARATELSRCLQGESYKCRAAASALAPTLSELEWAEQQVESACP